ncbi:MAG TPA: RNA polymerase sigma factor, partial [Ktedonobacteraceae bacterium]|nr:RNA polymerase sigma factor [Ktedonobacteraceae bacterium]
MENNKLKVRSPSFLRMVPSSRPRSSSACPNDIISRVDAEDEALLQRAGEIDEEADLVLYARQGDIEASNRLVQATYPRILNYFRSRLRNRLALRLSPQRVEEIAEVKTQDTYERAWKKLPDYHLQGKPFLVMLYGIAQKIWQETQRELAKERNVDNFETHLELEAEYSSCPEEVVIRSEALEELQRALKTLSATEQLIIHLHYREAQSYQAIARLLNVTENNAKNRSYRSRKKLKQLLA